MNIPDLPDEWEKKALIVVGALFLLTVIYAYNPFQGTPTNTTIDNSPTQTTTIIPFPKITKTKNTTNNTNLTNGTFKLTAEQAKKIATQSRPGYTVGTPIQGTVMVNNTNYNVWIVPLSKQNVVSKTIYIDANTGVIILDS